MTRELWGGSGPPFVGVVLAVVVAELADRRIAGLLIAFIQPVRCMVEEIRLVYTWARQRDNDRPAIRNEKLVDETIRNSTIRAPRLLAEVTVTVPLWVDLRAAITALEPGAGEVFATDLSSAATLTVRRTIERGGLVERAASELRLQIAERLREAGIAAAGE